MSLYLRLGKLAPASTFIYFFRKETMTIRNRRTSVGLRESDVIGIDVPVMPPPPAPEWHPATSYACGGYPHRGAYSPELGIYVLAAEAFSSFDCVLFWSEDDGATWTGGTLAGSGSFDVDHTNPFTHYPNYGKCFDVAWSPSLGLFVAVGGNSAGGATGNIYAIATSDDGKVWTRRGNPFGNSILKPNGKSVAWSEEQGLFVVGSDYSQVSDYPGPTTNPIATSPDGVTWTTHSTPWNSLATTSGFAVRGLAYSPSLDLWAAIAVGMYPDKVICTSPDGITWTARTTPMEGDVTNLESDIAWSEAHSLFIASDNDKVITSPDGITWTEQTLPFVSFKGDGVDNDGGIIYISGRNSDGSNTLLKSSDGSTWVTQDSPLDGGSSSEGYGIFISSIGPFIMGIGPSGSRMVAGYYV